MKKSTRLIAMKGNIHLVKPRKYDTPDGYPVDNIIFTITSESKKTVRKSLPIKTLKVLLVKRGIDPTKGESEFAYQGYWAFPGGFSNRDEHIDQAAYRELKEETHVGDNVYLEQFKTVYYPGRDPRGWIPTTVYVSLVREEFLKDRKAGDDASETELFSIEEALNMQLAFDHRVILKEAYEYIQNKMIQSLIVKEFLPKEFTIGEMRETINAVVPNYITDDSNFLNSLTKSSKREGILEKVMDHNGKLKKSAIYSQYPTQLYRFTGHEYLPTQF